MIFRITYVEGDRINKICEIESTCKSAAGIAFWLDHPEASDISKVEKIRDNEND